MPESMFWTPAEWIPRLLRLILAHLERKDLGLQMQPANRGLMSSQVPVTVHLLCHPRHSVNRSWFLLQILMGKWKSRLTYAEKKKASNNPPRRQAMLNYSNLEMKPLPWGAVLAVTIQWPAVCVWGGGHLSNCLGLLIAQPGTRWIAIIAKAIHHPRATEVRLLHDAWLQKGWEWLTVLTLDVASEGWGGERRRVCPPPTTHMHTIQRAWKSTGGNITHRSVPPRTFHTLSLVPLSAVWRKNELCIYTVCVSAC